MKSFKKIKTTIVAGFENFVNEVENQEAVVNSIISEMKSNYRNHQQQEREIERRKNYLINRQMVIQNDIKLWIERAAKVKQADEDKAKDCLRKVLSLETEFEQNKKAINQLENSLIKLSEEGKKLKDKLHTLQLKRNELLAHEQSVHSENLQEQVSTEVEDVFCRWEDKIYAKKNVTSLGCEQGTTLEEEFQKQELEEKIQNKLNSL